MYLVLLLSLIVTSSEGFSVRDSESISHQRGLRGYEHITKQFTAEGTCRDLWFTPRNGTCHCGDSIHDVVSCDEHTKEIKILDCFCMTNDLATNQTVVGTCFFNCVNSTQNDQYKDKLYHQAPSTCAYIKRKGTLCGECDYSNGSFPYAYSYDMDCIQCTTPHSLWLYIAVAFLPLTAFIALILIFRISAASPELRAFVCFAQILASPIQIRIMLFISKHISPLLGAIIKTYATLYGIWNLDFFRTVLPGICLHLTTLQVLALDYLIAVYPMLLMVIAYILVELHGHGFKPVLLIWKPFHRLFVTVRREWKIQTSIVDAFVTFLILSTTKFFSVSFDLLIPTQLFIANGSSIGLRLYYDPNIEYMKHNHLIYALLALTILFLFTLPLSLLIFSSFQCVRNFFRNHRIQIRVVQEFLHVFQQYYKEDCRWFAGYYFLTLLGSYVHIHTDWVLVHNSNHLLHHCSNYRTGSRAIQRRVCHLQHTRLCAVLMASPLLYHSLLYEFCWNIPDDILNRWSPECHDCNHTPSRIHCDSFYTQDVEEKWLEIVQEVSN